MEKNKKIILYVVVSILAIVIIVLTVLGVIKLRERKEII